MSKATVVASPKGVYSTLDAGPNARSLGSWGALDVETRLRGGEGVQDVSVSGMTGGAPLAEQH